MPNNIPFPCRDHQPITLPELEALQKESSGDIKSVETAAAEAAAIETEKTERRIPPTRKP